MTIRFGNSLTAQTGLFRSGGQLPDVVLDTTTGGHILSLFSAGVRNIQIGTGGTLDTGDTKLTVSGDSFINNGNIIAATNPAGLIFAGTDQVYSGSGTTSAIRTIEMRGNSLTLNSVNGLRVRRVFFYSGDIIHAGKVILGNNDSTSTLVAYGDNSTTTATPPGNFDTAPVFELGTGGQHLSYGKVGATRVAGPEINPSRIVSSFEFTSSNPATDKLVLSGGDLTVLSMALHSGEVDTGSNKIVYYGPTDQGVFFFQESGFINGTLVRAFTGTGTYTFPVGPGHRTPVSIGITALGINPSFLSIKPVDSVMPGLLPATSLSEYLIMEETGDFTGTPTFRYSDFDINGNEAGYKLWHSSGGAPVLVPGYTLDTGSNLIGAPGITDFNGNWGVGEQLDPGPVSISGSVLTSGGAGIRNALVTISGDNLSQPVTVQTGSLGTYVFNGLQAGEVYTVHVAVKRYRFSSTSRQVTPFGNVANIDFVANPQEDF